MKKLKWWIGGFALAGLLIAGYWSLRNVDLPTCVDLKSRVIAWGSWAPLFYVGFTAIAGIFVMPRIAILLAGGLIFGFWWGLLWVMVSSFICAAVSFYFARYIGRSWVERFVNRSPKLQKLTFRIEHSGINFVLFCRLLHVVPYTPLNLVLGLLPVSPRDYYIGTFFGLLPGTVPFVYFGTTLGCALLDGKAELSTKTWWTLGGALGFLALASAVPLLIKKGPGKKVSSQG